VRTINAVLSILTSFHRLVAFMLGYLRMTADEAIEGLLSVTSTVFQFESEWKGHPQTNTQRLEEAIRSLLLERDLPIDTRMHIETNERELQSCKVYVTKVGISLRIITFV
jgi:hypothetical protein